MKRIYPLVIWMFFVIISCSSPRTAGGNSGSETPNTLTAKIFLSDGKPAAAAKVWIRPANYLASVNSSDAPYSTNAQGVVTIDSLLPGTWVLEAQSGSLSLAIHISRSDSTQTWNSLQDTLQPSATAFGQIAQVGKDSSAGWIEVQGLGIHAPVDSQGHYTITLPAGNWTLVFVPADTNYLTKSDSLSVAPGLQDTLPRVQVFAKAANPVNWLRKDTLLILGSALLNAGTRVDLFPLYVPIRDSLVFASAQSNGSDLRIARLDGSWVNFEREQWNPNRIFGALWIRLDSLRASDTLKLLLYSGNASAADLSNASSVFSASLGYRGVWHLNANPASSTQINSEGDSAYNCRTVSTDGSVVADTGILGGGVRFLDGTGLLSCGDLQLTDSLSTLSLWYRQDSINDSAFLMSKFHPADSTYEYRIHTYTQTSLASCWDTRCVDYYHYASTSTSGWHMLAGVRAADSMRLYMDGTPISAVANLPWIYDALSGTELTLGAQMGVNNARLMGAMNEVRIEQVARTPAWIKAEVQNLNGAVPALHREQ